MSARVTSALGPVLLRAAVCRDVLRFGEMNIVSLELWSGARAGVAIFRCLKRPPNKPQPTRSSKCRFA